ncbi:MAG: iron ABC transporter permease [Hyphomicrobiales bacterium]|nr:MAG: iron ABC transporter permease [Hyphomicrobiales bacterium]
MNLKIFLAACLFVVLFVISLMIGVSDFEFSKIFSDDDHLLILMASRIPRNFAIVLTGSSLAIVGVIMQMIAANKFVEPTTAGTMDSAALGILCATLLWPHSGLMFKMLIATLFSLFGSWIFLGIIRRLPVTNPLLVPLVGIMLGGVIGSIATFIAYEADLLQYLSIWINGDFSGILRGRYELLWITFGLSIIAYFIANQLTIVGMGENIATNLGLNYRAIISLGLIIVAMVTAIIVTTVGMIPFIGLVIPNIVNRVVGDNLTKALPIIAYIGAVFTLVCDIIGRLIIFPYEITVSVIIGAIGSAVFIYLILKRPRHV